MRSSLGSITSPPIVAEREERKQSLSAAMARLERLREERNYSAFVAEEKQRKPLAERPQYDFG